MRDTATVIGAQLKIETPSGPTWHRYNDDGYGEQRTGRPSTAPALADRWEGRDFVVMVAPAPSQLKGDELQ